MRNPSPAVLALVLAACTIERADSGRPPGPPTPADSLARIEADSVAHSQVLGVLETYYRQFTARDWPALRRSFWPGATLATIWTPRGERAERVVITSLEEFLRRTRVGPDRLAVFSEEMLHSHIETYGTIASAWVIYRARFGTSAESVSVRHGVDAFTLLRHGGRWRIVSLSYVQEQPGRPLSWP